MWNFASREEARTDSAASYARSDPTSSGTRHHRAIPPKQGPAHLVLPAERRGARPPRPPFCRPRPAARHVVLSWRAGALRRRRPAAGAIARARPAQRRRRAASCTAPRSGPREAQDIFVLGDHLGAASWPPWLTQPLRAGPAICITSVSAVSLWKSRLLVSSPGMKSPRGSCRSRWRPVAGATRRGTEVLRADMAEAGTRTCGETSREITSRMRAARA